MQTIRYPLLLILLVSMQTHACDYAQYKKVSPNAREQLELDIKNELGSIDHDINDLNGKVTKKTLTPEMRQRWNKLQGRREAFESEWSNFQRLEPSQPQTAKNQIRQALEELKSEVHAIRQSLESESL